MPESSSRILESSDGASKSKSFIRFLISVPNSARKEQSKADAQTCAIAQLPDTARDARTARQRIIHEAGRRAAKVVVARPRSQQPGTRFLHCPRVARRNVIC